MSSILISTTPKTFIFVLMPFDPSYDDIYKFGIKGAAEDVGAYAERVDEQIFSEGILDRIFNQIHKADIVVADMTGRNPNVFYEVGYAHALGKIVILLTKDSTDIPFDLKHKQHTIYGGSIEKLRSELSEKLKWAISESGSMKDPSHRIIPEDLLIFDAEGLRIYPAPIGINGPTIRKRIVLETDEYVTLRLTLQNSGQSISPPIENALIYYRHDSFLKPIPNKPISTQVLRRFEGTNSNGSDIQDELTDGISLGWKIPSLPSKVSYSLRVDFKRDSLIDYVGDIPIRLRLYYPNRFYDYPFVLLYEQSNIRVRSSEKSEQAS